MMDRLADHALAMIAALNLLFFIVFAMTLAATVDRAHAMPVCKGTDLLAEMRVNDRVGYDALRAAADKVVNGDSIFYKIEKPGTEPSWLIGTMHVSDPRVHDLPPQAQAAFDAANTVVIETTEVLDQAKAAAVMFSRMDLTMLPADKKLSDYISEDDMKTVEAGLEKRGLSMTTLSRMRPWLISTMVALPPCEMERRSEGGQMLDVKLAQDAQALGKELGGLETLVEQLEAMTSLPIEFHAKSLVATLKIEDRITDVFETMIALYEAGDTGMIWPFLKAVGALEEGAEEGYADFEEIMVTRRNRVMADHAGPFIDKGGAFIAVGALHLPGDKGVVAYLRDAGYTVTAVR